MLKNTAGIKKRSKENVENLREEKAQDVPVPTKLFASSISGDQHPTKNSHPHLHRKEMHRSNPPYKRTYSEKFIEIGFKGILTNDEPRPQCVVCTEILANESLKSGKLKRHLTAKHSKFIDKAMSFFRRLEKEFSSQKQTMTKHLTILEKAQKASYEVAYLIAKDKKPYSIGETLIKPAAIAISQIINGDKARKEKEYHCLLIRISEISQDIKCQLIDRVKRGKYALQLDESWTPK